LTLIGITLQNNQLGDTSMRLECKTKIIIALIALCLAIGFVLAQFAIAQAPGPKTGGGMMGADSRAKTLTYRFKEADEDMQYCLFVSSKVSKDKKNPLIVTLHGMGAGPSIMVGKQAVDLAEAGGYILVSPMGYNTNGWYGSMPGGMMGGGRSSSGKDTNALSEKDVMNVLDIVCKEYNVDERRIYLMGHSMGGAGTLYLGAKYPDKWVSLAAVAPAAFTINPNILTSIKDKNVPVLVMRGDQDNIIAATVTKPWVDKLKELKITHEYKEIPGVEHGGIINACLPSVYEFFGKYSKKQAPAAD
jgi:predicted peptidase